MYEKGQKVVLRSNTQPDRVVIVEDLVADDEGNKLRVREPGSHSTWVVNPMKQVIVEQLED